MRQCTTKRVPVYFQKKKIYETYLTSLICFFFLAINTSLTPYLLPLFLLTDWLLVCLLPSPFCFLLSSPVCLLLVVFKHFLLLSCCFLIVVYFHASLHLTVLESSVPEPINPTKPPTQPNQCTEQPAYGKCAQVLVRWHFNREQKACLPFVYSGCGGNSNRFDSKETCEESCAAGGKTLRLLLDNLSDIYQRYSCFCCCLCCCCFCAVVLLLFLYLCRTLLLFFFSWL